MTESRVRISADRPKAPVFASSSPCAGLRCAGRLAAAAALVLAWAAVSGCASAGRSPSTPPVKVSFEPIEVLPAETEPQPSTARELEELYSGLTTRVTRFHAALEMIERGDIALAEEQLDEIRGWLQRSTIRCASLADCEIERFVATYEHLLGEQTSALREQLVRVEEMEMDFEEDPEREVGTASFMGSMPEDGGVTLFRGKDLRELIELNGPVKAALDDWLTWMRPDLMLSSFNYQYLRPQMAPIYEKAGLPEALLFGILATETRGKVHAKSRAGAAGPLQFMRSTGRAYGLTEVDGFDLRMDPAAATRANVAYLNQRFREYDNNLEKALAAYNGGEGRMRGVHRRYGGASFWDRRVYYSFPRETREYVPRVLAAAWLFLHPEQFGLELVEVDPSSVSLTVEREVSVGELAICLGQEGNPDGWFRTIRNLNPKLEPRDRIPVGGQVEIPMFLVSTYRERCLDGEIVAAAAELYAANYPPQPEMIRYTVRSGDSLGRIASRHSCASIREIAAVNRIRAPRYVIRAGQRLMIPTCD